MAFAPEVVVEATFGVGELATLMALLGLLMLRFTWAITWHPVFRLLAAVLNVGIGVGIGPTVHPFGFLSSWVTKLDNYVYQAIGKGITATEHAWHKLLLWNAYVLTKTGDAIANQAYDTLAALHLVHAKVSPKALRDATRPFIEHMVTTLPAVHVATRPATRKAVDEYPALERRVAKLEHELPLAGVGPIAIPAPIPVPKVGEQAHAASGAIVLPAPRTGELEHGLEWARGELGRLRGVLTVAGLVGLGVAVLGRLGLGWVRCSRVGQVGRALCGMDQRLLDALLADALLIVGAVSIVELGEALLAVESEVIAGIQAGFRELRSVEPLTFTGYTGTLG